MAHPPSDTVGRALSPSPAHRRRELRSTLYVAGLTIVSAVLIRALLAPVAPVLVSGDSETYLAPAVDQAREGSFQLSLKRTPGYPLLIAASLVWQGEELGKLALLQHALGVTTAVLACLLARSIAGSAAGAIAGMASGLAGNLLLYERYVMTETLFATVLTASVLLAVKSAQCPDRPWWSLLFGVAVGAASLVRPVAQLLLALAPLGLLLAGQSWKRVVVLTLLAGCGFGAAILPWAVSRAQLGESSELGALGQTLVGRIARHDRGGFTVDDPNVQADEKDSERLAARRIIQEAVDRGSSGRAVHTRLRKELGLSEAAADRLMRDVALEAIARDFPYYVSGTMQRFVRLWSSPPERLRDHLGTQRVARDRWEDPGSLPLVEAIVQSNLDPGPGERLVGLFQPSGWGPTLAILFALGAAVALLAWWRNLPSASLVLLPAAATLGLMALSTALVGGVARYRYPEDPLIFSVIGSGLVWSLVGLRRRFRR